MVTFAGMRSVGCEAKIEKEKEEIHCFTCMFHDGHMNTLHFHSIEQSPIEMQRSPYSWFVLFPQYERVLY